MITIESLEKNFGNTKVLKDVSITIPDGKVFGLVGVSGAGKSTLLRCINGLESFDSGSVVVNGVDVKSLSRKELNEFRANVGMIFQQFSLLERKTVLQNVVLPMKCHGIGKKEREARALELLDLVGLSEKAGALPRELSGGQKQRVAIARALTMNPQVLLCDEATSALDPNITRSILDLLKQINADLGITIIVVTHQMDVVKNVCDQVAILEHGVVTYAGDVQELFFNHPAAMRSVIGSKRAWTEDDEHATFTVIQRAGDQDVLARIAIGANVAFNVAWGGLDRYKTLVAGSYVISVPAAERDTLVDYLKSDEKIEWYELEGELEDELEGELEGGSRDKLEEEVA